MQSKSMTGLVSSVKRMETVAAIRTGKASTIRNKKIRKLDFTRLQ